MSAFGGCEDVIMLESRWIERGGVRGRGRVWSVGFGGVVIFVLTVFFFWI